MGHVKISKCGSQWGSHGNSVTLCKCVTIQIIKVGLSGANFEKFFYLISLNIGRGLSWVVVSFFQDDVDSIFYRYADEQRFNVY